MSKFCKVCSKVIPEKRVELGFKDKTELLGSCVLKLSK